MKDVAIFEDYPMSPRDLIKSFGQYPLEVQAKIFVELYQSHLAGIEKSKERTNKASEEIPQYYSIKEIARKMHVSEQTIRNWIKSGKIKCKKFGGSNRISSEDIMGFCLGFDRNLATCIENSIILDKETQEIVPFEKDKNYVYYTRGTSDGVYRFIVDKTDPRTFQSIGDRYGKDKANILYGAEIVKNADLNTFKVLIDQDSAKDKRHLYYLGEKVE